MLGLLGLLPILQAVAACFTIWGVAHTAGTADTVVHYGVGAEGPSPAEWMNSFGSIAIGLAGFLATHVFSKQVGAKSELMMALVAWLGNHNDPSTIRRLGLAILDWLEQVVAARISDPVMRTWWDETLTNLRTQIATTNLVAPVAVVAPVKT